MKKEIKYFKKENAGRSMTEMLGVLAVIGVLSVGGITGYKLAMNHYAANQIAYEINILRTDAKVKIAQGAQKLTFDEPYHSGHFRYDSEYKFDGYCFSEGDETSESCANASGYEFKLSNIPGSICPILEKLFTNMGGKTEINPSEGETEESSECQEESNIMYVVFEAERFGITGGGEEEGKEKEPCNPETCEGECTESGCERCSGDTPYWNGNLCVGCPSDGGSWDNETKTCTCSVGQTWNIVTGECVCSDTNKHWDESTSRCIPCESGEVWNNGQCEKPESFCRTNADCNKKGKSGYYCYTSGGKSCSVEFEEGSSYTTGKCYLVSSDLTKKAKINGTTYYGSGRGMTWWSACRLCAANAGADESVCASGTSGTTNEPDFMAGWGDPDFKCAHEINPGTGGDWGYCHADETTGKTSSSSSNVSETIVALRKMYNSSSYYLWLRNNYSSCNACDVYLGDGTVDYYSRSRYDYNSALCR